MPARNGERVWELIEYDRQLEESGVVRQDRERMVGQMAKVKPVEAEGTEKTPWKRDDYIVQLIVAKDKDGNVLAPVKKPNRYFMSDAMLCEKYGDPEPGERFWLVDGKKVYPSWPEDEQQWTLIFEVLEGDKKGDWLWVNFVSPRIWHSTADGQFHGKLAQMYLAADPTFNLAEGYEDDLSDLIGKPLRAVVEPKDDPQWAKVTDWLPLKPADAKRIADEKQREADKKMPVSGNATPEDLSQQEDIPFRAVFHTHPVEGGWWSK